MFHHVSSWPVHVLTGVVMGGVLGGSAFGST